MFKEVKRKAAVGERIKIVKPEMTFGKYKAGDVFVVDRADRSIGVYVDAVKYSGGNGTGLITHKEYVVLEPIAPPADLTQAFAQFIRENAGAIRKYLDEIDPPQPSAEPAVPKPPLTRAEVIEKARKDVAELTRIGRDVNGSLPEGTPFAAKFYTVKFHVNREKRVVTALIKHYRETDGKVSEKGIARGIVKCAPGDVFHAEIGKAIALRKALGLTIPAEYTDAPQPDEKCEGQIIACGEETLKLISPPRYPKDGEAHVGSYSGMTGIIIDDTDADYKEAA